MMIFLVLLGVMLVLPVVLILLHAFVRPATGAGLWLRTLALVMLCLLLVPAGLWIFPPWWTPWLLMALALLATLNAARRLRGRVVGAGRLRRYGEMAFSGVVILVVGAVLWRVMEGRQTPPGAVDIAFPLEPGRYLVLNGGHHPLINPHFMTLDDPRYADYRGQSHAVDMIAVDRFGLRAASMLGSADPADYHIFGTGVLAPCDGSVVGAEADMIDHRVPERDTERLAGNHLLIDCGDFFVLLAHLRQGSLSVGEGDAVSTGERVAEIGNSGQSGEPHLHVHAQRGTDPAAPLAGTPVPITFDGEFPLRNALILRD